jgi:hypothetical protein
MNLKKFVFILLVFSLFSHCKQWGASKKTNNPEYITEKFLYHINHLEFDEAKKYGTESTKQMLDLMKSLVGLIPEQEPPKPMLIEITSCDISGEKAKCHYTADGKKESIDLLKTDGKWLVDLKKEQFN